MDDELLVRYAHWDVEARAARDRPPRSGLQISTVRNILLAWVLTLPASMLIAAGLFLGFRAIIPDASAAMMP